MDLGIAGRKAIVCASSRGLGRGCALALAQAGCEVVINGRDGKTLDATAAALRQATGAKVTAVQADVATAEAKPRCSAPAPSPTFWSTTMRVRRSAISASSRARR